MRVWPCLLDVIHREPDSLAVVDRDRRQRAVLEAAIDEHDRRPAGRRLTEQIDVEAGGGRDQPIDLAVAQGLHMPALTVGVIVGIDRQQGVAGLVEPVLDTPHDRREERVGQVGDQDADGERAVGLQPSRDRVGPVAELLGSSYHPLGGLRVHEHARVLVERPRHRAWMDVSEASDVPNRHRCAHRASNYAAACDVIFAVRASPITALPRPRPHRRDRGLRSLDVRVPRVRIP